MSSVAISQDELNKVLGQLEELPEMTQSQFDYKNQPHVWIIKNYSFYGAVVGGRCFNLQQAQFLLQKASRDYPGQDLRIIQLK